MEDWGGGKRREGEGGGESRSRMRMGLSHVTRSPPGHCNRHSAAAWAAPHHLGKAKLTAYPQNFSERTQKKVNISCLCRQDSGRLRTGDGKMMLSLPNFIPWLYYLFIKNYYFLFEYVTRKINALAPSPLFTRVVWQQLSISTHPFLGWKDPQEKEKATHSSTLAWRIPWGRGKLVTTEWLTLSLSSWVLTN